jgi:peptidoglycan biosynthesis protein MviN/MurJ (putative lipid II flippase)
MRSSLQSHIRLILAVVPALALAVVFEVFLSPRHDYTGHYLAGYGGTLSAYMVWMRLHPSRQIERWGVFSIVPICLCCIALGAVTEATIFRLAKFDELDFCNQSLGAVLAGLAMLSYIQPDSHQASDANWGLIAGILFLGAGGCFAVA